LFFNKFFKKWSVNLNSKVSREDVSLVLNPKNLIFVLTKLENYHKRVKSSKNKLCFFNFIDVLANINFLFYSLCLIKKKSIKKREIDFFDLVKLSSDLKQNLYKPKPWVRCSVKKGANLRKHFLAIPTTKDMIVQQALKLILEPFFENSFYKKKESHFRSRFSCYTALEQIRKK